jgi:hypothetical protein
MLRAPRIAPELAQVVLAKRPVTSIERTLRSSSSAARKARRLWAAKKHVKPRSGESNAGHSAAPYEVAAKNDAPIARVFITTRNLKTSSRAKRFERRIPFNRIGSGGQGSSPIRTGTMESTVANSKNSRMRRAYSGRRTSSLDRFFIARLASSPAQA